MQMSLCVASEGLFAQMAPFWLLMLSIGLLLRDQVWFVESVKVGPHARGGCCALWHFILFSMFLVDSLVVGPFRLPLSLWELLQCWSNLGGGAFRTATLPLGASPMLEQSWWWAFRTTTLPLGASPCWSNLGGGPFGLPLSLWELLQCWRCRLEFLFSSCHTVP
jgi:hypothetical protein